MTKPRLATLKRIVAAIEDALLAVLLTAMIVLASAQILLRNWWDLGLSWSDPSLRLAVLWVALLGAMAATRDDNHITIDILPRFLPDKAKAVIKRISDALSALVCGIIAWHGGRFVHAEWQDGALAFGAIPAWIAQLIIPVGFGIIALRFLVNALLPRPPAEPSSC